MTLCKCSSSNMKNVYYETCSQRFFYKGYSVCFFYRLSDPQTTEEETNKKAEEMFIESASKADLATVTNEINIKAVKNTKSILPVF